jgi:hypothetical protein
MVTGLLNHLTTGGEADILRQSYNKGDTAMSKLRYVSLGCAVLLAAVLATACMGGATEPTIPGIHVFEGRISESGGNFTLTAGDETFTLEGNAEEFKKFSGQTAQVAGEIFGSTLKVTRVSAVEQYEDAS